MWVVAALQGRAGEVAEWNRAHPVSWLEGLAPYASLIVLAGCLAALLIEVVAWRLRRVDAMRGAVVLLALVVLLNCSSAPSAQPVQHELPGSQDVLPLPVSDAVFAMRHVWSELGSSVETVSETHLIIRNSGGAAFRLLFEPIDAGDTLFTFHVHEDFQRLTNHAAGNTLRWHP
jgi:hypothetical protein